LLQENRYLFSCACLIACEFNEFEKKEIKKKINLFTLQRLQQQKIKSIYSPALATKNDFLT